MATINEVTELTGLGYQTLTAWVRKGYITPMKKGGKGYGNAHVFNERQLYGLAIVGSLYETMGISPEYAKALINNFEQLSDQEFNDLVNDTGPWMTRCAAIPEPDGLSKVMMERLLRVAKFLAKKAAKSPIPA